MYLVLPTFTCSQISLLESKKAPVFRFLVCLISPNILTCHHQPKADVYHLFIQIRTAALRLIVRSWLDVPTFATRRHACHHAKAGCFRVVTSVTPGGEIWDV